MSQQNVKVILVHKDATPKMKEIHTRVIDARLLQAVNREGQFAEARAIYDRMLGIKSTTHTYEISYTTELPFAAPELPVSTLKNMEEEQENKSMSKMAKMLSDGIAEGVAQALAARDIRAEATQPAETPQPQPEPQPEPKSEAEQEKVDGDNHPQEEGEAPPQTVAEVPPTMATEEKPKPKRRGGRNR